MINEINTKPNLSRTIGPQIINYVILNLILFSIFFLILMFKNIISEITGSYNIIFYSYLIAFILLFSIGLINIILKKISISSVNFKITKTYLWEEKKQLSEGYVLIPTSQITDIDLRKGIFFDKIFNTATIYVKTAGTSSIDMILYNIKYYESIFTHLQNTISNSNNPKELLKVKPNSKVATTLSIINFIIPSLFFIPTIIVAIVPLFFVELPEILKSVLFIGIIFLLIIGIIGFISIIILIKKQYDRMEYTFYDDSIIFTDGFLVKRKTYLELSRITNSNCDQSFVDRLIRTHTITLDTAGSSGSAIKLVYINNGEEINNHIQEILKKRGKN